MYVLTKIELATKDVRLYVCRTEDDQFLWDWVDNIRFNARIFASLEDAEDFRTSNQGYPEIATTHIVHINFLPKLTKNGRWIDYMYALTLDNDYGTRLFANGANADGVVRQDELDDYMEDM